MNYFPGTCRGSCNKMDGRMAAVAPWVKGMRYCSMCRYKIYSDARLCPCCRYPFRTGPKKGEARRRLEEGRLPLYGLPSPTGRWKHP